METTFTVNRDEDGNSVSFIAARARLRSQRYLMNLIRTNRELLRSHNFLTNYLLLD